MIFGDFYSIVLISFGINVVLTYNDFVFYETFDQFGSIFFVFYWTFLMFYVVFVTFVEFSEKFDVFDWYGDSNFAILYFFVLISKEQVKYGSMFFWYSLTFQLKEASEFFFVHLFMFWMWIGLEWLVLVTINLLFYDQFFKTDDVHDFV